MSYRQEIAEALRFRMMEREDAMNMGIFREEAMRINHYRWYERADAVIRRPAHYTKTQDHHAAVFVFPGAGKTMGISVPYAVQPLCLDRSKRVGIFSKAKGKAEDIMHACSHYLQEPSITDRWGKFLNKGCKADSNEIRVLGAPGGETTPSIMNLGMGGQAEGSRFHVIIMDDPIDAEISWSPTEVNRFIRRIQNTFLNRLEPGGTFIVIGSRFRDKDGYHWIIKNKMFEGNVCILPALYRKGGKLHSLVPERFEVADLLRRKEGLDDDPDGLVVTDATWQARYMQTPRKGHDSGFSPSWIDFTDLRPITQYCAADPAMSDRKGSDYTGGAAFGWHPNGADVIVNGLLCRRTGHGFAPMLAKFMDRSNAREIWIEENNSTIGDHLRSMGRVAHPVRNTKNKVFRISETMEQWLTAPEGRGKVWFHRTLQGTPEWAVFMEEYHDFPMGEHEHILDALELGLSNAVRRKPGHGKPSDIFRAH